MFTKQLQGLLLHTSAYNFARRYLPIKKLCINIFTQFWKFSKFNPVKKKKKKINAAVVLYITAKEKSDQIEK